MGEETNLPYRILNNLCINTYSTSKRWSLTHYLLTVGSSSKDHRKKSGEKGKFTMETSARGSRLMSSVISQGDSMCLDMMWWEWHFTFRIFLPKTYNSSPTIRKTSEEHKLGDSLQNTWWSRSQKTGKNLRSCYKAGEANETWQLKAICILDGIPEQKKDIFPKN